MRGEVEVRKGSHQRQQKRTRLGMQELRFLEARGKSQLSIQRASRLLKLDNYTPGNWTIARNHLPKRNANREIRFPPLLLARRRRSRPRLVWLAGGGR